MVGGIHAQHGFTGETGHARRTLQRNAQVVQLARRHQAQRVGVECGRLGGLAVGLEAHHRGATGDVAIARDQAVVPFRRPQRGERHPGVCGRHCFDLGPDLRSRAEAEITVEKDGELGGDHPVGS